MVPFFVIFVACLRFWGAAILGLRLVGGAAVDVDVGVGRDYVLVSVILGALVMPVMQMQMMRRRRMRNPISMPFCFLFDLSGRKRRRTKG